MSDLIIRKTQDQRTSDRHPFPVIDFKFRNSGNGTALLSKYHIEILKSEIDVSPYLQFDWRLGGGEREGSESWYRDRTLKTPNRNLNVGVRNFGWGAARNFSLRLEDETLIALFGSDGAEAKEVSDENRIVGFDLNIKKLRHDKFLEYAKANFKEYEDHVDLRGGNRWGYGRYHALEVLTDLLKARTPFVTINSIQFRWTCQDVKGRPYEGDETVDLGNYQGVSGGIMIVTEQGFIYFEGSPLCGMAMPPGPTFCALIDPDKGAHVRSYPISRRIDPGDVERFQVLIGTTKSCFLDVRLAFDVDGQAKVQSGIFELKIENRRDQQFHLEYRDGQEILAQITEDQELANRGSGRRHTRDW